LSTLKHNKIPNRLQIRRLTGNCSSLSFVSVSPLPNPYQIFFPDQLNRLTYLNQLLIGTDYQHIRTKWMA